MAFSLSRRPHVKTGITMGKFCSEARDSEIPVAVIRAVDEVESAGAGFFDDQRPKILVERHYFYRILKKEKGPAVANKVYSTSPDVCNPNAGGYIGGKAEYGRLAKMTEICHANGWSDSIALRCASWGRYQIMGDNFRRAGFSSVEKFVEAMFTSEDNHLEAFINYVQNTFLDDELQKLPSNPEKYAAIFAEGYNGPGYRRNKYHIKIPNAFKKFNKQKVDCSAHGVAVKHVVDAMPGDGALFQAELEGFAGTSLDDRMTGSPDDGLPSGPEGGEGGAANPPNQTSVEVDDSGAVRVKTQTHSDGKEKVVIEKPVPVGFWEGLWKRIMAAFGTNVGFEVVADRAQQVGALGLSPNTWKYIGWLVLAATAIALIAYWWNRRQEKQRDEKVTQALIEANTTEDNTVMLASPEELAIYEAKGYKVVRR